MGLITDQLNSPEGPDLDFLYRRLENRLFLLARKLLCSQPADIKLLNQTGELVDRAFLRNVYSAQEWKNSGQFVNLTVRVMQQLLIEAGRKLNAQKRLDSRNGYIAIEANDERLYCNDFEQQALMIQEVMSDLEKHDLKAHQVFRLQFLLDMNRSEISRECGLTQHEVRRLHEIGKRFFADHYFREDFPT